MSISTALLKAEHIGVRELKKHLSIKRLSNPLIITDRGKPVSINMPYEEILDLVDIIDELSDPKTLAIIAEGRKAIREGSKGISVSELFGKYKTKSK